MRAALTESTAEEAACLAGIAPDTPDAPRSR